MLMALVAQSAPWSSLWEPSGISYLTAMTRRLRPNPRFCFRIFEADILNCLSALGPLFSFAPVHRRIVTRRRKRTPVMVRLRFWMERPLSIRCNWNRHTSPAGAGRGPHWSRPMRSRKILFSPNRLFITNDYKSIILLCRAWERPRNWRQRPVREVGSNERRGHGPAGLLSVLFYFEPYLERSSSLWTINRGRSPSQ